MASPVYTKRFVGLTAQTGVDQVVATVPAEHTWILRDILLVGGVTANTRLIMWINQPGPLSIPIVDKTLAPSEMFHLELRQGLVAGEGLRILSLVGATSVWVTGYEFS